MAASDKDLEAQLLESGNRLVELPSSVDELLPLLDRVESCLSKVEQSPSESMQNALSPSLKALVDDTLLGHSDVDVKVAVASCISEITRITAPDAPYDDDQMKEVFQLIVSSFENLCDKSSRSYTKRTSILETVAKVRSCVVMLDLECDALILEMFEHFLKAIRDYHPENVFSSMETIMTLVLEESEDIPVELLTPILDCVKIDNEDVLPIARKLGERVLEICAAKVKPYLVQAVKDLGISLDDYSKVLSTICQDAEAAVEQNEVQASDENMAVESRSMKPSLDNGSQFLIQEDKAETTEAGSLEQAVISMDRSPQSAMSNGITQAVGDDSLADSSSLKKQEDDQRIESTKDLDASSNADPDSLNTENAADTEKKLEQSNKTVGRKTSSSAKSTTSENPHVDNEKESADNEKNIADNEKKSAENEKESAENEKESAENEKESADNEKESADNEKETEKFPDQEEQGEDLPGSPHQGTSAEAAVPSENDKESDVKLSSPKALDSESATVASTSPSLKLTDESRSKKSGRQKKKDNSDKEAAPSSDDASKKVADGISDSEVKTNRRSGKKVPVSISNENKVLAEVKVSKKESGTTSDSEAKPLRQLAKKVDGGSKNEEGSSAKHVEDKKRARGKTLSEKDRKKTSIKDDSKDTIASPKSLGKSTKDEQKNEETPKTNSKRKRTPGKVKESGDKGYDEDLIGMKVRVWWPKDQSYYNGFIESFDPVKKKHKVLYNDGDEEVLNLKREKWEFIEGDSVSDEEGKADLLSPDASTEIPLKKKVKIKSDDPSKQKKIEASPKKGASSSKSKSIPKSGLGNKAEGKSKDDSKSVGKSEEVSGGKSKDHTPKSASSKSANVASKSSSKSRNNDSQTPKTTKSKDESSTPSTKSKQEIQKSGKLKLGTPKTATVFKDKTHQSGGKSSANGTGKVKSGSSKIKEVEDAKESSSDSGKPVESTKGKSLNPSKAQESEVKESEVKTGKKRRRSTKG
ncbi:sister chromatid cohesion protein PDS5 homolog C isoform X2 [Humulus lupulus]|uniref:sister chromatid cohesion protein PDS5 homolog C isoform X2 n=1 Tax=Humulus lupulus TaxID=3486 RepID=UPI002B402454|nr:sister chromatid cohesion protein PDS5 homolog C isoform X2 [Humulus lupulus]